MNDLHPAIESQPDRRAFITGCITRDITMTDKEKQEQRDKKNEEFAAESRKQFKEYSGKDMNDYLDDSQGSRQ